VVATRGLRSTDDAAWLQGFDEAQSLIDQHADTKSPWWPSWPVLAGAAALVVAATRAGRARR
jgi:hypothetical protein